MIESFNCEKTKRLFNRSGVAPEWRNLASVALRKLNYLHAANQLADLSIPPANRLEKLRGDGLVSIVSVLIVNGVCALSSGIAMPTT